MKTKKTASAKKVTAPKTVVARKVAATKEASKQTSAIAARVAGGASPKPKATAKPSGAARSATSAAKTASFKKPTPKAAPKTGAAPAEPAASKRPAVEKSSTPRQPAATKPALAGTARKGKLALKTARTAPVSRTTKPAATQRTAVLIGASEKEVLRKSLIEQRNRLLGQVDTLKHDSLQRHDSVNTEEDGTDAFDRQFALSLASTENDLVVEIEDAIRKIDEGTYGSCETCDCAIEMPRLNALPFAKNCLACQAKSEHSQSGTRMSARFSR